MTLRSLLAAVALGVPSLPAVAADLPPAPVGVDPAHLAATLRSLLLAHMPDPVVETDVGWGRQRDVVVGMAAHREGRLRVRMEAVKAPRNDGLWQKVRVHPVDPQRTLGFGVRDVKAAGPGVVTFDAYAAMDVRLVADQQFWKSGARLYSGEARGRCRAALKVTCEVTSRLEPNPGSVLPTAVMRVRVTSAELFYTDLVCERILGLDGKPAAKVGEAAHKLMKAVKPGMEAELLAKANAAVVKAADTKEVRFEFDRLLVVK